jgi:hypothetical protein
MLVQNDAAEVDARAAGDAKGGVGDSAGGRAQVDTVFRPEEGGIERGVEGDAGITQTPAVDGRGLVVDAERGGGGEAAVNIKIDALVAPAPA